MLWERIDVGLRTLSHHVERLGLLRYAELSDAQLPGVRAASRVLYERLELRFDVGSPRAKNPAGFLRNSPYKPSFQSH